MTEPHHDNNQFWIGLFLGGIVGAFMIVLMGTEKGKKLAQKLQEEGFDLWEDTKDSVGEKLEAVQERVADEAEVMRTKGAELIQKGREMLESGKEIQEELLAKAQDLKEEVTTQVETRADQALAHIEELQERGRQTTADLRKRLFKNIPKKSV